MFLLDITSHEHQANRRSRGTPLRIPPVELGSSGLGSVKAEYESGLAASHL